MDSQRNILLIGLVLVSFLLFQKWQTSNEPVQPPSAQTQTINQSSSTDVPMASHASNSSIPTASATNSGKLIQIKTDVLTLTIDTVGGDIIDAKLNKYGASLNSSDPFVLLQNDNQHNFIAQSGLIGPQGIDLSSANRPKFSVAKDDYSMANGIDQMTIPLTYEANGITYVKTFTLKRGSYAVDVSYHIKNHSGKPASVEMYSQLRQNIVDAGGSITMPTYHGGAYSTQETRYKKYSFSDMKDRNLSQDLTDGEGWVAMIQHYFAAAWIPRNEAGSQIYSLTNNTQGYMGVRTPVKVIPNDGNASFTSTLWVGPKLQTQMAAVAPNLDLVVDYGWLWFLAKPLHWLLSFIHSFVNNWGVAIIILTFIVRGAMYPLTKAQYTSMAKMRMLQPKLQAMRERIGDDRQRMSQEMMQLYKTEKVNPLGGCLPILLQMPIFIALYWALMESVELRHAPFFGWIHDLSAPDQYYILPVLMGISMFLIQKMSPTTVADPMQQKIMTFMPVVFTVFFLWFPSGLVLYWLVSNIVTLIQQTIIYRSLEKKGLHSKKEKTAK